MLQPNTFIHRRYQVTQLIGVGGTGAVYQAYDHQGARMVALKQLLLNHMQAITAFEREARILADLHHPALPEVLDYFSAAEGQFLVMEFVAGADLAALLQHNGQSFPLDQVAEWADQLLTVLTYLHTRQPPVVHRDIKPHNLKLKSGTQELVLLDFGLAKGHLGQPASSPARTTNSVFGYTLHYAPLEQIQGTGTDQRTDLYSLAATLYHLLAGTPPVDALTRTSAAINGNSDPLTMLHAINPHVPPAISQVLNQAMSLRRDERPASAATLRQQLQLARQPSQGEAYTGKTLVGDQVLSQLSHPYPANLARRRFMHAILPVSAAVALGALAARPLAGLAQKLMAAPIAEPPVPPTPTLAPVTVLDTSLVARVTSLATAAITLAHVQAIAVAPDGRSFAVGAADGTILVQPIKSAGGVQPRRLEPSSAPIHCLAYSSDGKLLAAGARNGRVTLWRMADGLLLHTFRKHFQSVSAVAFSPDGQFLASASTDDMIRLWRMSDGVLWQEQEGYYERDSGLTKDARSLAFSPDSQMLLIGYAGGMIGWRRVRDGQGMQTFAGHTSDVYSLAFSPDGQRFVSGANDLRVWRVSDGQLLHQIDAHREAVTNVAVSPDGQLLGSGSYDSTVKLWSASDGKPHYTLAYSAPVHAVAFAPDGKTLIAGGDQGMTVWRLERDRQ
jgi:eukaryotic-like serine/threonine-protein kinase